MGTGNGKRRHASTVDYIHVTEQVLPVSTFVYLCVSVVLVRTAQFWYSVANPRRPVFARRGRRKWMGFSIFLEIKLFFDVCLTITLRVFHF